MGADFNDSRLNQLQMTGQGMIPAANRATKDAQVQINNAGQQQLSNNRLDTSNPFSSVSFGPDGKVSQSFTGGLGQAFGGLQNQASSLGQGMDWSQFGQLGNGDQARTQAIDAAYNQATSRLDPMWSQREDQARTRLLNQGLDENSEAYKNAMSQLGNQRTDAYNQAMYGAIGQGQAAGDSVFRNNMAARQQSIQEALKARGMPLEELGQMQGFLSGQPQYNQDNSSLASALASGNMGVQGVQNAFGMNQQLFNDRFHQLGGQSQTDAGTAQGAMSGIAGLAGLAMMFGF